MERLSTIQPILASTLLTPAPSGTDKQLPRTACATKEIDDALRGGLDLGVGGLTCISGDKGTGKTALAFAFLTTHLLNQATNQAVVIDTTGTFDVLRLYSTILSRLRRDPRHGRVKDAADAQEAAAEQILGRVKIMRVFDFLGMIEAISEVRERLEIQRHEHERKENDLLHPTSVEPIVLAPGRESRRKLKRIRSTIPDSDDEMEDEDDDIISVNEEAQPSESAKQQENDIQEMEGEAQDGRVGMIVVDNITHAVSPMMKTNYAQASALLTTFLRSLSQLTAMHKLSTILINAVTTVPKALSSSTNPPLSSIFTSADHLMPALSPILPSHADLHLLITPQPLTRQDAVILESLSNKSPSQAVGSRAKRVSVVEVLGDRYGDRIGRWAAFDWDESGLIVDIDSERGTPRKQYHLPAFASKVVL